MNIQKQHWGHFVLGTDLKAPHQNDKFDINESDMVKGVKLLVGLLFFDGK